MTKKIDNFVICPRKIVADLRDGSITRAEYDVYVFCRLNSNPYGIYTTHLKSINDDLFKGAKTENYVNKILLSLKSKRYIFYKRRPGHRGSFDIHFGNIPLPNQGGIKDINHLFEEERVRGPIKDRTPNEVEPTQRYESDNHRSKDIINDLRQRFSRSTTDKQIRGSNTHTNNNKNKDTY